MDFESLWWLWIIIGAIFLIIELMSTTFFALWMAIAALVPALLSFLVPHISIEIQILCWIISMIICSLLWVRFSKRDIPLSSSDVEVLGQIGVLAQSCDTKKIGVILLQKPILGQSQWSCVANTYIPADTRVIVIEKLDKKLLRVDFEKK